MADKKQCTHYSLSRGLVRCRLAKSERFADGIVVAVSVAGLLASAYIVSLAPGVSL